MDIRESELMGMNALKLADEYNAKKAFKYFNEVYTTGKPLTWIDGEIIRKDGSKRNLEASASLRRDLTGQPIGFRGIIRDVTEHRQAEELYKTLAEKSMAGVYVVQDGKFCFINSNAASYAGYTREELLDQEVGLLVSPEDSEKVRQNAKAMLRGEMSSPYEYRIITKQGETRWIMETVTSILYGGRPAILGNSMDITEQKRAEEALREREQFFSGTLNDMLTFVAVLEPDGDIIFVNNTPLKIAGMNLEDIIGKKFYDTYWWEYSDEAKQTIREDIKLAASGKIISHPIQSRPPRGSYGLSSVSIQYMMIQEKLNTLSLKDVTSPSASGRRRKSEAWRSVCSGRRRWRPWAPWQAASPTISTMFWALSSAMRNCSLMDVDKSSSIRPRLVNIMNGGREGCRDCAGSADPGQKRSLQQRGS